MADEPRNEIERVYETLNDHAGRYWTAEEENSRRLASRVNLLLTGGIAVIGLGLYKLSYDLASIVKAPLLATALFILLLTIGLILLIRALWLILWVPKQEGISSLDASNRLRVPAPFIASLTEPAGATYLEALKQIFSLTYAAADELTERNAFRKRRVDSGQRALVFGLLFIASALAAYLIGGLFPPSPRQEASSDRERQQEERQGAERGSLPSFNKQQWELAPESGTGSAEGTSKTSNSIREANPETGTAPRDSR